MGLKLAIKEEKMAKQTYVSNVIRKKEGSIMATY